MWASSLVKVALASLADETDLDERTEEVTVGHQERIISQ